MSDADPILERYVPSDAAPWNLARVVHLHRRAGFAATWEEAQRDLQEGPKASLDRLLRGEVRADETFVTREKVIAKNGLYSRRPEALRAWWLWRMLMTPDPLGERLTLLWHDHFATGLRKVGDLRIMHRQNELFRTHARGKFGDMLRAVVKDPAVLIWLDAPANRKGSPNENLGRELMELFTLGIGHYTETDVKEAARALTGWTLDEGEFYHFARDHDGGEKEILGNRGTFDGDDLVAMLLEHPATSERLATRITGMLLSDNACSPAIIETLAAGLRERDLDLGWAVREVLSSKVFFDEPNLGGRVLDPVGFCVGAVRMLELLERPPSTLVLADWTRRLGMDLFDPPNVGGWPGGRSWLATRHVLGRVKFAAGLLEGKGVGLPGPIDVAGLVERHGGTDVIAHLSELFLGRPPAGPLRSRLEAALGLGDGAPAPEGGETARRIAALLLASPESQLA